MDLADKYRITSNRESGFAFRGKKVLIGTEEFGDGDYDDGYDDAYDYWESELD